MNSSDRLRITPEDIAATTPPVPARIVLSGIEVNPAYPAPHNDIPDEHLRSVSGTGQDIRHCSPGRGWRRFPGRMVSLTLGLLLCLSIFAHWSAPSGNWLERLDVAAGSSIVRIEVGEGSLGTGFVMASVSDCHWIVTNRHVLTGPDNQVVRQCRVLLRSGIELTGSVVAIARDDFDLALIYVTASGLQPLGPVASFSEVRVGEPVAAVGHPFGFDYTVTEGIVSSKRSGLYLQTSAPINPGNSGGPLINRRGEILGINTLTLTSGQGIGLAIRADLAREPDFWVEQPGGNGLPSGLH